ncbi:MAG: HAMP domain-containing histidine kinase, partial [Tyzzerella sp.]|nr:HAMP domain-containing histidine kinase [Tyzzerella sp.]
LLTLSKIDAGVLQLECSKVDVYTALTLATENLSELLAESEVSVSIPDKGCIEIDGDMEWTMEAFINVIKNCIEHSAPGSVIHCDYSANPLYTEILIWDEGKGFKEEDIPHLFERFYKGKETSEKGIGIGLSLARSIFEMQNGNITARNMQKSGACFEIRVYSH